MKTEELIITLFYEIDDHMSDVTHIRMRSCD